MTLKQRTLRQNTLSKAHLDFNKALNLHAFFKLHDLDKGEDLVQDTYIKTWKYMCKGGKIETMKSFLYHVLNHLIIDEYRKHKAGSLEVMVENGFEPSIDESTHLFNTIDGKVAALLIEKLPVAYRKIMYMRYMKDLSISEIVKITGQTKNSVAVKTHRGLEKLKLLYIARAS